VSDHSIPLENIAFGVWLGLSQCGSLWDKGDKQEQTFLQPKKSHKTKSRISVIKDNIEVETK
jgi:hypothetical protein